MKEQQQLADAQRALSQAMTARPAASTPSTTPSTAVSYSAQQLVAYQAAVDAAAVDVWAAQESIAQATIVSPIDGTVFAVALQVGDEVTAGSSTATVVIVGAGGDEVATTLGVADIAQVKLGDHATVVADGTSETLTGKVVFVGQASTSGATTTYPVVIGLTASTAALRNGAMATTTINLATSKRDALTVPTSAVHTTNAFHLVTVLAAGKTTSVPVHVGVVGAEQTEITSGLQAGQTVVLADLRAAVPASNTSSRIATAIGGGLTGTRVTGDGTPGGR
jgi:multidrug efflux pump subunit AcrA (membrane-fusion protein)